MQDYIKEAQEAFIPAYNRFPIMLDHGDGVYLYDTDHKKYLDFGAGIAVYALGYNNPVYNQALKDQVDTLLHTSNLFYNEPSIQAAKAFNKASHMDRVFFTNSGTEAIEGAIKLARKYYYKKHHKADSEIIAMEHSFHGRSLGALSVTGTKKYREAFEPLIGGVVFAAFNDIKDIESKMNEHTCAVLLETVQGEGGIYPASKEFLKELRELCTKRGILLILDEIQCGMGRTGTMFAYEQYGVLPDIMTSAKALGCGVPVGAFAAVNEVANAMEPGDHGTTYGFNPFVTKAVTTVFELFESMNLLEHTKKIGAYLYEQLEALKNEYDCITAHRGIGLIQGLEFKVPVKDLIVQAEQKNLILIAAGSNIIRFVPPLVIEKEHVDEMISILKSLLP